LRQALIEMYIVRIEIIEPTLSSAVPIASKSAKRNNNLKINK